MNYPRKLYQMTQEDFDKIIKACQPVPMIMLQCGGPRSQQENANDAWAELGGRMGFDSMTVEPSNEGKLFFTAVPLEPEEQKLERLAEEARQRKEKEIASLEDEISEKQQRIKELNEAGVKSNKGEK